jgi:hypothetical protein
VLGSNGLMPFSKNGYLSQEFNPFSSLLHEPNFPSVFCHKRKQFKTLTKCGHSILDFPSSKTTSQNKPLFFFNILSSLRYSVIVRENRLKHLDSSKRIIISYETIYGTHLLHLHLGLYVTNKRGISISKFINNHS